MEFYYPFPFSRLYFYWLERTESGRLYRFLQSWARAELLSGRRVKASHINKVAEKIKFRYRRNLFWPFCFSGRDPVGGVQAPALPPMVKVIRQHNERERGKMVNVRTTYTCEKCKQEYETQEQAEECEDSHYVIVGIIDERYSPTSRAPESLQVEITLGEGGDKKDVIYKLVKEGWGAK